MNKQPQKNTASGSGRSNQMPSSGKNPNKGNSDDQDMRQAKMDEDRELKEEASLPEDTDPALDEQDLDENHLSVDEADKIEWEPHAKKNKKSGL